MWYNYSEEICMEKAMSKREELDLFILRADEFINSKYIVADIKIVNLLKTIASSDTLVALFQNCLSGFDYESAKDKYLVKSRFLTEDKGEFVSPTSSKELLAFVICILSDLDAKTIQLNEFLRKYFYEDGTYSSGYTAFINAMIKPFKNSVVTLMESVIEGKLQDPLEALTKEEERKNREKIEKEKQSIKERELSKKIYGESIKSIKSILLKDKTKLNESKLNADKKAEAVLVIDMLANVIESEDKDAIKYAYIAYKYVMKSHPFMFFNRVKQISKYITDVTNEL